MKGRLYKTAVLLVLAAVLSGTGGLFFAGGLSTVMISCAAEHGGGSPADSGETLDEAETKEVSMDLEQYDLTEIQDYINSQGTSGWNLSFKQMMKDIMAGRLGDVMGQIGEGLRDALFSEVRNNGHMMGQIIILGIIGAVFANFSMYLREARYRKRDSLSPICYCLPIWQPAFLRALPLQEMWSIRFWDL